MLRGFWGLRLLMALRDLRGLKPLRGLQLLVALRDLRGLTPFRALRGLTVLGGLQALMAPWAPLLFLAPQLRPRQNPIAHPPQPLGLRLPPRLPPRWLTLPLDPLFEGLGPLDHRHTLRAQEDQGLMDPEEMVSKGFSRHRGLTHRSDLSRIRGSISPLGETSPASLELQEGLSLRQGLVPLPASRDLLGPSHLPDSPPLPNPIPPQRISNRWKKPPHLQTLRLKTSLPRLPKCRWMIKQTPRIPKKSCQMTSWNQVMDFSSRVTPFPRPLSRLIRRTSLKTRARKWLTRPNSLQRQLRRPFPLSLLPCRNSLRATATQTL